MPKTPPAIDYGICNLVDSCPRLDISKLLPVSYREWQKKIVHSGQIEISGKTVKLATTQLPGGGLRLWFICPACNRRCAILHNNGSIGCRTCLGLRYRSSRYKNMIENDLAKNR